MKWKLKLNWRKVVLFLVVSAGLLYLTGSLLMAAGVIMLLFVVDSLLGDWEYRRNTRKLFDDLREENRQRQNAEDDDAPAKGSSERSNR